jgi:hypothetical protein
MLAVQLITLIRTPISTAYSRYREYLWHTRITSKPLNTMTTLLRHTVQLRSITKKGVMRRVISIRKKLMSIRQMPMGPPTKPITNQRNSTRNSLNVSW